MISRNLTRRLEGLESRIVPLDKPQRILTLEFVEPGGRVVETKEIILGGSTNRDGSPWRARQSAQARARSPYR
jgi:hypothetical protein